MRRRKAAGMTPTTRRKSKSDAEIETFLAKLPQRSRDAEQLMRMAPAELAVRKDFARKLQEACADRGWNGSELARQAAKHMAKGKLGKDMTSKYLRGIALPNPPALNALARALGKKPKDLLSPAAYGTSVEAFEAAMRISRSDGDVLELQSATPGLTLLTLQMRLPVALAQQIYTLVDGYRQKKAKSAE